MNGPSKYIAAGFVEDSKMLLNDFVKLNSKEFTDFSRIWKKYNFSCIYMGREPNELRQFTSEIYQLVLQYTNSASVLTNVGAIYLLYALYRNQIIKPPVKIRVTLKNWESFQYFLDHAKEKKVKTLCYVINYLHKNAFDFVANSTLFGPRSYKHMQQERPDLESESQLRKIKMQLTGFGDSNALEDLKETTLNYNEVTKGLIKDSLRIRPIDRDLVTDYHNFSNQIDQVLNGEKTRSSKKNMDVCNIGTRRSEIKASAFEKRMANRWNLPSFLEEDDTEQENPSVTHRVPKIKRLRQKRPRAEERRVGRPRKVQQAEDSSDSDYEPPVSVRVTKRNAKRRGPIGKTSYLDHYEAKV